MSNVNLVTTTTAMTTVPSEFICPITQEIMRYPLLCRTGFNYEKAAIMKWLECHNNTCPLTREVIKPRDLVSNHYLQSRIESWCYAHNIDLDGPATIGAVSETDISSDEDENENPFNDMPVLVTCSANDLQSHRTAVVAAAANTRRRRPRHHQDRRRSNQGTLEESADGGDSSSSRYAPGTRTTRRFFVRSS